MGRVEPVPFSGSSETVVLDGHVPKQVPQRPAGTRRGSSQIRRLDSFDDVDALPDGPEVQFNDAQLIRSHARMICIYIRYVTEYNSEVPEKDSPAPSERRDVAALMEPVRSALIDMEIEVLSDHGLSMWAYVVLLNLADEPVRTQAALADAIKADRSRIISVLDDLQDRGLIDRRPDPEDRRVRLLTLTAEGRRLSTATQHAIQAREERMLAVLSPRARTEFLRTLQLLGNETTLSLLRET